MTGTQVMANPTPSYPALSASPAAIPAAEAFCAGNLYIASPFSNIRFIQDPCNTIQHPFPF
ncbi:MAG: hypothetical protein HY720_25305 [Planctomycetes bacterium]|nr:hypothetical protein [Planctomycetota bacterium]